MNVFDCFSINCIVLLSTLTTFVELSAMFFTVHLLSSFPFPISTFTVLFHSVCRTDFGRESETLRELANSEDKNEKQDDKD